jgi:predicted MPP superfamily phosphohydrolase
MKLRLNRRQFFRAALWGTPLLAAADAAFVEPRWLKVKRLNLAIGTSGIRFVHFTDLHHKGDREWLVSVVSTINACKPEFVCFTGDLIEESQHLSETLELLQQIQAPLYGVPGNHDYWSGADFEEVAKGFEKTGGAWLIDRSVAVAQGRVHRVVLREGQNTATNPRREERAACTLPELVREARAAPVRSDAGGPFAWWSGPIALLRCSGGALRRR